MDYFVSDLHLGHGYRLNHFRGRLFSSIEEHDSFILDNLFKTVKRGSNLYILGDTFYKKTFEMKENFFKMLGDNKINVFLIQGNHDKSNYKSKCIKWICQIKDIVVEKQSITLCHYNMVVWNKSHYNSWLLYGHQHIGDSTYILSLQDENTIFYKGKKLNVNLEFHNWKPWSFEEIKEYMGNRNNNWDILTKESSY